VVFGVTETLAILVGLPLTIISLMALQSGVIPNVWVQLVIAAVLAVFVPLIIADRVLPEGDRAKQARGYVSDVLAVVWLGTAMLFVGVGGEPTAKMLRAEADLLTESGMAPVGAAATWLAGAPPAEGGQPAPDALPAGESGRADVGTDDAGATAGSTGDAAAGGADAGGPVADNDSDEESSDDSTPEGDTKSSDEMTPAEVFDEAAPGVVSIRTQKGGGPLQRESGGTGFVISHEGVIATNNHVVHGSESVRIKLRDGRWTQDTWLLAKNTHYDLALLGIDPDELHKQGVEEGEGEGKADDDLTSLSLGNSDDISTGEQVVAIGNPLGLEYTLTDGIVSARRVYKGRKMIQISVPLSPGNSGGPLLNMEGEVVGVSTQKVGGIRAENLNLAVPANRLEELIQDDYPNRRRIGEDDSNSGTW
jgi:S1-C subfamily serine protease